MLYLWTQNYSQIIGTCPGHYGKLISQNCVLKKGALWERRGANMQRYATELGVGNVTPG